MAVVMCQEKALDQLAWTLSWFEFQLAGRN